MQKKLTCFSKHIINCSYFSSAAVCSTSNLRSMVFGSRTWIGEGTIIIMAGVGKYMIIGSGCIVTWPAPSNIVAVGNPVRPKLERKANSDVRKTIKVR